MLPLLIVALVVVLVALFVDWSAVGQWLEQRQSVRRQQAPLPQKLAQRSAALPVASQAEPSRLAPLPILPPAMSDPEPSFALPAALNNLMEQADAHFRKGDLKLAEEAYLQVAAQEPRASRAYARLGVIYLEQGENYSDAEEAFRQALKTDPDNGNILNNLGLVLYQQDRYADAIRQFEQAVRLDESNASRHANLGMAYLAMRQYAKAESSFKKALKLSPNEAEYKDLLEEALEKKKAHRTMIRR